MTAQQTTSHRQKEKTMAEKSEIIDEMLAQVTGGTITTDEEQAEYCDKAAELLGDLIDEFGADKIAAALLSHPEIMQMAVSDEADELLARGEIEYRIRTAVKEISGK
jgi:hypothetical protein